MDAWEVLLEKSALGNGDAWEHLNAQEGEEGGVPVIIGTTSKVYYDSRDRISRIVKTITQEA